MLVLALDTTTRQGSAALARDGRAVATVTGDPAITHGERLPGELMRLLDAHGVRMADVDLFAVAAGPGSLTGLRIGIATLQGLALANGKPLAGISALDAVYDSLDSLSARSSALSTRTDVAVWMDAGRGQVFSAIYSNGDVIESALVDKPADILERWSRTGRHPQVFAGDGATGYRELIRRATPGAHIVEPLPPLAPSIARLAEAHVAHHGAALPDAIRPIYIRRSDVELKRDAAAGART